ncbi:MAG: hypothetical protein PGN23_17565 [Sphingomonas adhaesiva]|uniref:hypothetical protein n=1 Tax=Sphingomonas adhaesiva TaxID=28212 RepID=UPI002FF9F928
MTASTTTAEVAATRRSRLLARIDRIMSVEDERPAAPLATALAGDDAADLRRFLDLTRTVIDMIDAIAAAMRTPDAARIFVRGCVAARPSGPRARDVANSLMIDMLDAPEARYWRGDVAAMLIDLHRRGGSDAEWKAARDAVLSAADTAVDPQQDAVAALWEAAAWPADEGRSVLSSTFRAWRGLELYADHWSREQEARAQATLETIWQAQEERRARGEHPDYPALFRDRDPALFDGFERNLRWVNRHGQVRVKALAQRCIALLANQ